jgi:hypothetical protein
MSVKGGEIVSLFTIFQTVLASLGMSELAHPIFDHSPVGIRFDIGENGNEIYGEDGSVNPRYVAACLERCLAVYHRLKTPPDLLVIEGYLDEEERVEDLISSVRSATDLPQPDEIASEGSRVLLLWDLQDFHPGTLLEGIIRAELGGGHPILTSSVYFICTRDRVLFHVYDDRGADLVAARQDTIQHIYREFTDWILDDDREKIEDRFCVAS